LKAFVAGLMVLFGGVTGASAQGGGAALRFTLDRVGPPLSQYTISVGEDGSGVFNPRLASGNAIELQPGEGAKAIRISPPVVKKLFAAVPMVEGGRCETHNKGIAKTGVKVLRYAGGGREAECTYNYSDDERVNEATNTFEAIAETMQYGDRLAAKLRFDRLGLDMELDGLQSAVADGRALEVENIAPVLKSLVEDERVMDRVRRKAEQLLQTAGANQRASEATLKPR
jgi:hypothetical protein